MHLGFGLHQCQVDPFEDRVLAESEGIMLGLLDRVGAVPPGVIDRGDHVADRAGDACLARRVMHVVEIGVVELTGEEWHGVMAASAPAGSLGRAVALQCHLPRLPNAHQVSLVVERAAAVRRVKPAVIGILVALEAVLVHHQGLGRDELAVGGDGLGREEVLLALLRPLDAKRPGILEVQETHDRDEAEYWDRQAPRPFPADPRARQPVLDVKPDRNQRSGHVKPGADVADPRVADLESANANQDESRDQGDQTGAQENQTVANGPPVGPFPRGCQVREAENQKGNDQEKAEE